VREQNERENIEPLHGCINRPHSGQGDFMRTDWVGNQKSIFSTLGASSHTNEEREYHDYYATEPKAVELLLTLEKFNAYILEPACGEGHISKVLEKHGYYVKSTDLVDRGFGEGGIDFFSFSKKWDGDIITNPPYKYAKSFIRKALQIIPNGNKIAMFLKLQFLEGKERKEFFKTSPPKTVYVSSSRLKCAKNGKFVKEHSSAVAFCWYIWVKGYKGDTVIKWFN